MTTNQRLPGIGIYESYVAQGAPSNKAGVRRGYGLTAQSAHDNAQHWANQAPWARVRWIAIADLPQREVNSNDERVAWAIVGVPDEYVPVTPDQRELAALIEAGKYATAVRRALTEVRP